MSLVQVLYNGGKRPRDVISILTRERSPSDRFAQPARELRARRR